MNSNESDISQLEQETAWFEHVIISNFRIWHIISFCLSVFLSILIILCCCIRFRIPRTKQDIDADYRRKHIMKKFRENLQQIKNSEMDEMDLQKAIDYMQHYNIQKKCSTDNLNT